MRTLLVCCLAVLAVAASTNSSPRPFKGQQTYVYRFDTQVSTSLIGASPAEIQQAAATRMRADALLSFTNDRHARLQLQHIRIAENNGDLPKSQRVQPLENFEKKDLPAELKQTLEMPLSFSYVDGVIERINFHEDDSTWSKNIKRAVLNMIQLNLKRNDVQGLKMQSTIPVDDDKDVPMFSVPEITLEGECEAIYVVQKAQKYGDEDEKTPFNVTKTINFSKCKKTADVTYGYQPNPAEELRCLNCLRQQRDQQDAKQREEARFGHCLSECQANKINEDKDMERSTFARFELTGKPDKYAIRRSSMMSQYIVKAQNPASQNTLIQIVAVSELTFKNQMESSQQNSQSFKQSSQDESLLYSNEFDLQEKRFYMFGDEEFEGKKESPFANVQKKDHRIAHAIRQIVKQWSDKKQGYELDAALMYNRIVEILRQSTVKEIKAMERSMVDAAGQEQDGKTPEHSQQLATTIFQDALASAATRNTLFVLAEKIMKSEIKPIKAAQLLKVFTSNQHSPSESQANILEKIARHEAAHRSGPLYQTAWLSFGQAVGAICQDRPSQGQKRQFRVEEICSQGKKTQYTKILLEQFRKADTIYEQILFLKAIGNAAMDNTMDELQTIVKSKQYPILIRIEAIDAMRRLRTSMPQRIRSVLMPLFQNQREQPEVRMAAFSMIVYTLPEKSALDQLIFSTINDRSSNVKSFVLTTMESLSKSPSSAEQMIANHLKASLKMIKVDPEELRSSRKYRVPIYVSEQEDTEEQNIFFTLTSIVSPSNMLPIHMATQITSALNGEATQRNLELSITQKNLEQWYERIGDFAQQYSSSNEQEKESMENQSAKDLRSIYSSLGVKSRRVGSYYMSAEESSEENQSDNKQQRKSGENEPFGMIVIRTNDVDTTIVPISEQQLPHVVRKMLNGEKLKLMSQFEEFTQELATGKHFRQHIAMVVGEKRSKVPTTSGLPLALLRQTSGVGSVDGQAKVRFESDNLESSRGLTAELKLRSSAIVSHIHQAQIWSPVVISGVETVRTIEVNAPVQLKLRADRQKTELKITLPQNDRVRLIALHTLPITYTKQFDMASRTPREARVKTINNWALEHTLRESQQQQKWEAIEIEGHYHHLTDPKQLLLALYTTENNVHLYYKPTDRTPKEVTLRVIASAFQKHQQHSRPEMDNFYGSKGFQSINSDEDQGMQLDSDDKRRESLKSYSSQYSAKDAYKHKLRFEAEADCGHKIHKVSAQLDGACDSSLRHCKLFLEAERDRQWTMKTKIQTVLPEQMSGRQGDDDEEQHMSTKQSRMLVQIESEWGSEQRRNNQVNVRLQGEPTRMTYWRPSSNNKWARFLNKFDVVADYQLDSRQKHMIERVYELLKARMFWSQLMGQLNVEDRRANDGEIRATIVLDPITRRHANISIQTPQERLRAQSVELPMRFSPYSLRGQRSRSVRSFGELIQSVSNYGGAQCDVNDRRIRTFDGVSYRVPSESHKCWVVLAKDCSRETPRFVVMMKRLSDEETKLKIMTPRKTIELVGKQSGRPIVKINGEEESNEETLSENGIERSYNEIYVRLSGVKVQFDGQEVKVKVGGMYKNLQCGLCGHYSDEESDDFQMSNGRRSNSIKEFHKSFTVKNSECDGSSYNKFYNDQDSSEFSIQRESKNRSQNRGRNSWFDNDDDSDSDESQNDSDEQQQSDEQQSNEQQSSEQRGSRKSPKPVKRTKVIEYHHKVCFSTEPVKKCPHGSSPDDDSENKQMKVQFACLERSSSEARRLLREVRQGKVITPRSDNASLSFVKEIEQPSKCQAVY